MSTETFKLGDLVNSLVLACRAWGEAEALEKADEAAAQEDKATKLVAAILLMDEDLRSRLGWTERDRDACQAEAWRLRCQRNRVMEDATAILKGGRKEIPKPTLEECVRARMQAEKTEAEVKP